MKRLLILYMVLTYPILQWTQQAEKKQKNESEQTTTQPSLLSKAKEYMSSKFHQGVNLMTRFPLIDLNQEETVADIPFTGPFIALTGEIASQVSRNTALALGANPNLQDVTGKPIIITALQNNRPDVALQYLRAGANPNTIYQDEPILIFALRKEWVDLAIALLQKYHANPNVEFNGFPAVGYVFTTSKTSNPTITKLMKAFIDAGIDVNMRYATLSLLSHAAIKVIQGEADPIIIKILLNAGAIPDQQFLLLIQSQGSPQLKTIVHEYQYLKSPQHLQTHREAIEKIISGTTTLQAQQPAALKIQKYISSFKSPDEKTRAEATELKS